MSTENITLTPSEFTEKFVFIEGNPFSFADCQFMLPVYDCANQSMVVKAGRQVGKSWMVCDRSLAHCCTTPYFETLIVHPTQQHTEEFSHAKLAMAINRSPLIKNVWFTGPNTKDQVKHKGLNNGASIKLRHCFHNANSVRGISVNAIVIDEVQDILTDSIPVIQECLTGKRAPVKYQIFAGTPKSHQHAIEKYWKESTQCEWLIKCNGCGTYNVPGVKNIQEKGFSCSKCGKLLDRTSGEFVAFDRSQPRAGFRIPQLISPWINWKYNQAGQLDDISIWHKFITYDEGKFYNEVLGLPFEDASKPISELEIMACCDPIRKFYPRLEPSIAPIPMFAGIDWGHYGPGTTVLLIGGMYKGKLYIFFGKKYIGRENEPGTLVPDIIKYCKLFQVRLINADFGGGWGPNFDMRSYFPDRFSTTDYSLSTSAKRMVYNKKIDAWMVHRTGMISEIFNGIKKGKMSFPKWETWEPFARDILSVYADWNESKSEIRYDHHPDTPDDALHSLVYLMIAAELYYGEKILG